MEKRYTASGGTYRNTKLLLEIYREVSWRVGENIYDIKDIGDEFGSQDISRLIDYLSIDLEDYTGKLENSPIEDKLINIAKSKEMIELIDQALLKLKSHPNKGEVYFNILKDTYITSGKITAQEIQERNHISPSSFYRYKKKAIEILGSIIWGLNPSFPILEGMVAEGEYGEYDGDIF